MLKLDIRLDEDKISEKGLYNSDELYDVLKQAFSKHDIRYIKTEDGTYSFYGNGKANDYAFFGRMITSLQHQPWFMEYVDKWIWYNSDDGKTEDDYAVEDVLKHYTDRDSAA